ncbi:hypothetical protein J113_22355 [Mycobacterium tuberculosis CAS/NITR204]|uniref:TIGR02569 family protein n=2 Tax=Bacteria TaxID=2 RepID=R4MIB3_MYCTX|nr:hypothetical protein J113_22355 [Mycobacterium tuberculosis CAS/NITR204]
MGSTRLTGVNVEPPPEHVLVAFGLAGAQPILLGAGWEGGWRCGEVVLSMVADNARAAWSARVRETLFVDGVRLARPVRSTDGRYVVSGWRADTFVAGAPEPRHDEVVSAAVRLHEATGKLERPRFLTQGPAAPWAEIDVFVAADRAGWEERPLQSVPPGVPTAPPAADPQRSIDLINQLAGLRKPTKSPNQLVHGDLYGTVLFAGTAPPGITDITPYWRPASWAAGVAVVDALSWGAADAERLTVERAAGVAPDVVARVDVPPSSVRAAPTIHRRSVSRPGPHRGPSAASALNLLSPAETHSGSRSAPPGRQH